MRSIVDSLVTIGKLIGLAVFTVAGVFVMIFFGMWFLIALGIGLVGFVLVWTMGAPITLRVGSVKRDTSDGSRFILSPKNRG